MTSLTEQWQKGELLEGFYYARCDWSDEVEIRYVHNGVDDWKEIVAKVPSYEEWQEYVKANDSMFSVVKMLNKDNYQLEKENTKLKELLKECKRQFEEVELYRCDVADTDQEDWFKISTNQANVANKMIAKINQVLGEDK